MKCTECGGQIAATSRFCPQCGTPIIHEATPPDGAATERGSRSALATTFGLLRQRASNYVRDPERILGPVRKRAAEYLSDPVRTKQLLTLALAKASKRRIPIGNVDEISDYLQVASRLVQSAVRREYTGLSARSLTLVVAAILYYVSPIDIIPDFIPVAGLLDDAAILAFVLRSIRTELDAYLIWEAQQERHLLEVGPDSTALREDMN